jgi:hypothetical protein
VAPSEAVQRAHLAVLAQDRQVDPAPAEETTPAAAQLPLAAAGFTGRTAELARLDGLLDADSGAAVVISAVSGTAGVGKIALAVQWAHRRRERFPDGQLYVNLRGYDPDQPVAPAEESRSSPIVRQPLALAYSTIFCSTTESFWAVLQTHRASSTIFALAASEIIGVSLDSAIGRIARLGPVRLAPEQDIDPLGHQLVRGLGRGVLRGLVVFDDQLDPPSVDAAPVVRALRQHLERLALQHAETRAGARDVEHRADPDRVTGAAARAGRAVVLGASAGRDQQRRDRRDEACPACPPRRG